MMHARLALFLLGACITWMGCTSKPTPPTDPCNVNGESPCTDPSRTLCVDEDGNARCLCNPGTLPRPSGACEPVSSSNCPEHAGDSAEPNDCLAQAREFLPSDSPRTQSIDPVGDYDFISFPATKNHVYVATIKSDSALLPRGDVFDQGGRWLTSSEQPGENVLAFKAQASGTHYIRISQSPVDPSVAVGAYTLSFATSGEEDHGDVPQEATAVAPSLVGDPAIPVSGRFEYAQDQDWFNFSGSTTQLYRIAFDPAHGAPPLTSLFTASNLTIPKWTAQQEVIDFDLTKGETAYLVVYAPQALGSYRFQFTRSAR